MANNSNHCPGCRRVNTERVINRQVLEVNTLKNYSIVLVWYECTKCGDKRKKRETIGGQNEKVK